MSFTIAKGTQDILDKYKKSALDIVRDYNDENGTKNDYQRREIFELLQNADDESNNGKEVIVKFSLVGKTLRIQNTGNPFIEENIGCLMYPRTSNKSLRKNTIGNKGLGFRAVLNWADTVRIITKQFAVEFSKKHAVEQTNKILNDNDELTKVVKSKLGETLPATIFAYPKMIATSENDFSTTIELVCLPEHIKTIKDDLNSLDFREMLFLSNISKIIINIEGQEERIVERIKDNERNEIIISDSYNPNAEQGVWKIHRAKGTIKDKEYEFIIARNSDERIQQKLRESGVLYSYFKVKGIAMPFPFLVHGTFDLTSDRNLLQESSPYNHELINRLAEFIGTTAIEVSKENDDYNYKPLSLMIPSNMNMGILDNNFNFSKSLSALVSKLDLFPTINKTFISMAQEPKFSKKRFCDYVNPEIFTNLLKHCDDEIIVNYLISNCKIAFYGEDNFTELINNDLEYYDLKSKNELIRLCLEHFNFYAYKGHNFPSLIIDNKCNTAKSKVFNNPTDTDNYQKNLPTWTDFDFINQEQEKQLRDLLKISSNEIFVNTLTDFGLENFRLDRIVGSLFTQAKDSKEKTCEVIKWLYNYWQSNNQQFGTSFVNVEPKVISRSGKIVNCSKCFFGREYDNSIGENIISFLNNAEFLANVKTLGLENENIENVKMFFSHLDVKSFPQIQVGDLPSQQVYEYIEYNSRRYTTLSTNVSYDGGITHNQLFAQWGKEKIVRVANIENLKTILEKASFNDILAWVLNDKKLYSHIIELNEIDDKAAMIGYPSNVVNERRVGKSQMSSWLRKQFKETNWIKTKSGKKANTYNCTMVDNKLSPVVEVVDIDYKNFDRTMKTDIERLFSQLGIANDIMDFVDLSKEKIYEILLQLPEMDKSLSIGRPIYTKLNLFIKTDDGSIDRLTNNNKQYEEFRKAGMVLSKQNGESKYRPIGDVYYVDKKTYSDDIINNYPCLELARRAGASKIQKLFCVKNITTIGNISVDYKEHSINQEYNVAYKKLLPCIYAKRINADVKNKELNLLNKSKLVLVEHAETTYTIGNKKQKGLLKDYELIFTDKTAYIKIPNTMTVISHLRNEKRFCGAVAEMLTTLLDVDSDKAFFREIIGCNSTKEIEEIFKDDGDTNLQVLNLARSKFKNGVDYKLEFWNSIANAKSVESGEKLLIQYGGQLPPNFDYDEINADKNIEHVINLFSKLNIDIDKYNGTGAIDPIDLIPHFSKMFFELKQELREKYLCYVFTKNNAEYEDKKNQYDFDNPVISNSVKTKIKNIYENMFSVSIKDIEQQEVFDIEKKIEQAKPIVEKVEQTTSNGAAASAEIDYRAINEQIKRDDNNGFDKTPIEKPESSKSTGNVVGGGKRGIYNKESDAVKDLNGFKAESKVFHTLRKKYGKTGSVVWLSGNGEKAGEIAKGNDSLGYDMKYTDKKGITHFVEVKSTSGDGIEFTLTRNEFNFAQENKKYFEIAFVFIKNEKAEKPKDLGKIFMFEDDEDIFTNSKFSIEQSEFKIRAKIKE